MLDLRQLVTSDKRQTILFHSSPSSLFFILFQRTNDLTSVMNRHASTCITFCDVRSFFPFVLTRRSQPRVFYREWFVYHFGIFSYWYISRVWKIYLNIFQHYKLFRTNLNRVSFKLNDECLPIIYKLSCKSHYTNLYFITFDLLKNTLSKISTNLFWQLELR